MDLVQAEASSTASVFRLAFTEPKSLRLWGSFLNKPALQKY